MPYSDGNPTLGEQVEQHMETRAIHKELSACWDEGYAEGKREGAEPSKGVVRALRHCLKNLKYRQTFSYPRAGPKTNGYAYFEVPDWLGRQWVAYLEGEEKSVCEADDG